MTDIVNLNAPTNRIWLSDLTDYCEISQYCKENNIMRYAYSFSHRRDAPNSVWKFGRSDCGVEGDRAYRQAGNLPGWPTRMPRSPYGHEMRDIVLDYEALNPSMAGLVHKNDMFIDFWNVTYLKSYNANPRDNSQQAEIQLYNQYVTMFGKKPFGNLRHPGLGVPRKPTTAHLDTLFTFTDTV
jgi:hypothetical protein